MSIPKTALCIVTGHIDEEIFADFLQIEYLDNGQYVLHSRNPYDINELFVRMFEVRDQIDIANLKIDIFTQNVGHVKFDERLDLGFSTVH